MSYMHVREQGVAVIDVTDRKEGRTQGGRVDMNEVRGRKRLKRGVEEDEENSGRERRETLIKVCGGKR